MLAPGIGALVRHGGHLWTVVGRSFGHRGECPVLLDLRSGDSAGFITKFGVRADQVCGPQYGPAAQAARTPTPAGEPPPIERTTTPTVRRFVPPAPAAEIIPISVRTGHALEIVRRQAGSRFPAPRRALHDLAHDRPCDSEGDDEPPRAA